VIRVFSLAQLPSSLHGSLNAAPHLHEQLSIFHQPVFLSDFFGDRQRPLLGPGIGFPMSFFLLFYWWWLFFFYFFLSFWVGTRLT